MTESPDIRLEPRSGLPLGPKLLPQLLNGRAFRETRAAFMLRSARDYGDLVRYSAFGRKVLQFNHPELVQEMLVRDAPHHHRSLVMQRAKDVLGEGLLTSEEPLHMRQRRLAQPAFHRQRVAAYGEIIGQYTARMTEQWKDGSVFDVRAAMLLLALQIVGKTLFDTDVDNEVEQIAHAVDSFSAYVPLALLPFSRAIQRLPIKAMRNIRIGRELLDALIYRMIAERRANPGDRGDLLSMLLAASDVEEGQPGQTARMSDTQVRDECLTILLAGHETTANALSFALWLLAQNPEVQRNLQEESWAVLGGRTPTAADYAALPLAEQVFAEALRLYPPVWVTGRTAAEDYVYRGIPITRGTMLLAPQFVVHRDARFHAEPERFDPMRFTAEAKARRPKFSYFPFGAGSRQCIGEGLAWMEGALVLAGIAQNWSFTPVAGAESSIPLEPSFSLRPRGPVLLRAARR
jgi:cytochrome P450